MGKFPEMLLPHNTVLCEGQITWHGKPVQVVYCNIKKREARWRPWHKKLICQVG